MLFMRITNLRVYISFILVKYNNSLMNFDDFIDKYGADGEDIKGITKRGSNRSVSPIGK